LYISCISTSMAECKMTVEWLQMYMAKTAHRMKYVLQSTSARMATSDAETMRPFA
jgi:hypothetical protein